MSVRVLVVNAGSSSLKLRLLGDADVPEISGWTWPYNPAGDYVGSGGVARDDTGDDNQSAGGEDAMAASG